jgi:hypothetical protein
MTSTKILRQAGVVVGSLALLSTGAVRVASAQESAEGLNPTTTISGDGDYSPGDGFRLSEDLIIHPRLELEGGYQPNVFYEDDSETPVGSPILRVGVGALLGTQERDANAESAARVTLNADVMLTWNQFLESGPAQDQSDLGINAAAGMKVAPQGKVSFELRDGFTRAVNPPPAETARELDRDRNDLTGVLSLRPGGGALEIYAKATWLFERFEQEQASFADRNSIIGALGSKWQWLPKTQVNGELSFGLVTSDSPVKPGGDSTPLRITIGTSTLITPDFGTVLKVGYGNAFYSAGPSYNSYLALAELRYAIGPTIRIAGGYSREFADSLIGNYRVDDMFYARFSAQMLGQLLFGASASATLRQYDGLPTTGGLIFCNSQPCSEANATSSRDDVLVGLNAHLDYQMNQWLMVGAQYQVISDTTDSVASAMGSTTADSVGYVWQEFMLKATAKF